MAVVDYTVSIGIECNLDNLIVALGVGNSNNYY